MRLGSKEGDLRANPLWGDLRTAADGLEWGFSGKREPQPPTAIQLTVKTLLRHVQELVGFLVASVQLTGPATAHAIEVLLAPDPRRKPRCALCGSKAPCYDRLPERAWKFVPLWGIPVTFHYGPRRLDCRNCGIHVEPMPWNEGKHTYSKAYMLFLARWARRLSWKETAHVFKASWDAVARSVEWVVAWGLEHRTLEGVTALGVDELHWGRGKKSANYVTLIYQLDAGARRLLWVGQRRTAATLRKGFAQLEKERKGFLEALKVVCSDMWKPYLKIIAQKAAGALNVLDPFHVAKHLNTAVDNVRRGEQSRMNKHLRSSMKRGRFLLLKRGSRVRGRARTKLNAILKSMRQTARAWELKEAFHKFWKYRSEYYAAAFLREWTTRTLRSRIEPMRKVARMLRAHEELLLNYFKARRQFTNSITEGLNHKARVSLARSFGHRSFGTLQTVLYHTLGHLPEPPSTHKFC